MKEHAKKGNHCILWTQADCSGAELVLWKSAVDADPQLPVPHWRSSCGAFKQKSRSPESQVSHALLDCTSGAEHRTLPFLPCYPLMTLTETSGSEIVRKLQKQAYTKVFMPVLV